MSPQERWAAKRRFLDRTIARGDDIRLATPIDRARSGSFYERELQYLARRGYGANRARRSLEIVGRMIDMSVELPNVLAGLVARLEEWGFSIADQTEGSAFGDRMIVLSRPPLVVRLVSDRGQWYIELARSDWSDWFDPDVWRSYLRNEAPPTDRRPLNMQAAFVLDNLQTFEDAVADEQAAGLLRCLKEWRKRRSDRRLGFDAE